MSYSSTWADDPSRSFHVEHAYEDHIQNCPICGADSQTQEFRTVDTTVSQLEFCILRCTNCDAHFTNPRPSPKAIGEFYRSNKYISHTNQDKGLVARIYRKVRSIAVDQKLRLIQQTHHSGKLLDVGCGTGTFLQHAALRGFKVTGVEPSQEAGAVAKVTSHAQVHTELSEIPLSEQFNVVTMWHVLEHMHQPAETLSSIRKHLHADGLLVIAVPNRSSWDATHFGPAWAAWDVPRHLTHFSEKDLTHLLERTGFKIFKTRPMWFDAPYVSILSEQGKGAGPLVSVLKGGFIGMVSNLIALVTSRPTSSTIYLARKAEPS